MLVGTMIAAQLSVFCDDVCTMRAEEPAPPLCFLFGFVLFYGVWLRHMLYLIEFGREGVSASIRRCCGLVAGVVLAPWKSTDASDG